MSLVTHDFAILGDYQPEGLLVAAALARKGYSVALIPSQLIGETPGDELVPAQYPAMIGSRKVDDLLFRAGFFRLEDSGLQSLTQQLQVLLPKNRVNLEGSVENWFGELRREFPEVAEDFERVLERVKKDPQYQKKSLSALTELERRSPAFGRWFKTVVAQSLGAHVSLEGRRQWLKSHASAWGKLYSPDARVKTSYSQYLVDHIRKWGVHVIDEPTEVKASWMGFQLTKSRRCRSLIINSLVGYRVATKHLKNLEAEKFGYWLYYDRLDCPISLLPEPLQENSVITAGDESELRRLHIRKDLVRDEATLTLGTWLPFEDSKSWTAQIEKGRQMLLKVVPFLDLNSFRPIPSILELTEMRGECVRRGQVERLELAPRELKGAARLLRWIKRRRPSEIARNVFSVNPIHLPFNNRNSSFAASLELVEHFDQRRRGFSPKSLFCI